MGTSRRGGDERLRFVRWFRRRGGYWGGFKLEWGRRVGVGVGVGVSCSNRG